MLDHHIKIQEDYLVANLLDYYRSIHHENAWFKAAQIALNQIERSANSSDTGLNKRLIYLASQLKNNISVASIRAFAREAVSAAKKSGLLNSAKAKDVKDLAAPAKKNLEKKALRDLGKAISAGNSQPSAVNRAAHNLYQHKLEDDRKLARAAMTMSHPLKETFNTLNMTDKPLAKEDIRNHLLRLKKNSTPNQPNSGILFNVLKKAQSFSPARLHQLLGDDLFFLCRPLGFVDQNDEIILVEVPSNAHLHSLTYRKLDILGALKHEPSFQKAKNIRFKVSGVLF